MSQSIFCCSSNDAVLSVFLICLSFLQLDFPVVVVVFVKSALLWKNR